MEGLVVVVLVLLLKTKPAWVIERCVVESISVPGIRCVRKVCWRGNLDFRVSASAGLSGTDVERVEFI